MHPKIKNFIALLKSSGYGTGLDERSLSLLKDKGATSTEAMISIHLGFATPEAEAEKRVLSSNLWEQESIQDIAYQTFLYLNYDPEDPNFEHDDNRVKFYFKKNKNKENNSEG